VLVEQPRLAAPYVQGLEHAVPADNSEVIGPQHRRVGRNHADAEHRDHA